MISLSDPTRRLLGYLMLAVAMTAVVVNVWMSVATGDTDDIPTQLLLGAAFGVVATVLIWSQPSNGVVWALLWAAMCGAWGAAFELLALRRTGVSLEEVTQGALPVAPADLDVVTAMVINLGNWLWLGFLAISIHLVLLFPSGRASSPLWRAVMWVAAAVMFGSGLVMFVLLGPWVTRTYGEIAQQPLFNAVGLANLVLLILVPAALANLIVRFRRSTGVERLQFRWLTWSVAVLAFSLLINVVLFPLGLEISLPWLETLISDIGVAGIPISIGIAITRYRLYDIDLVISRTLVFGVLVGFITVVYAVVVVGVGSLVGGSSLGWSIAATAVVALVFEPVRNRVQRWINRLVYGRRATPYEVLSDLTGRLAATEREEGLLERMASQIAEGTGAQLATVWMADDTGLRAVASEPAEHLPTSVVDGVDDLRGTVIPVRSDETVLGAFAVEARRGDDLTPIERRLVEDLAGSASLVMQRLRLDQALEQKAAELAESRRRLLDAQDVERRRLERELNEEVRQRVVALKLELGVAARQAEREGAGQAAALVTQMATEAQDAIDQIQALAHGIYPPLLEAEGLGPAVRALAAVAPGGVEVESHLAARHPLATEGAVYMCISEALTNAVKHGRGPIRVELSDLSGDLVFRVSDAGPGFDPATVARGSGFGNMADRLDTFGGSVTISSRPGSPTVVEGVVAVAAEMASPQA